MPTDAKYVFMASMDVAAEKEDLFNEVYDEEHVPNLLAVPGVLSVTRIKISLSLPKRLISLELRSNDWPSTSTWLN